MKSLVFTSAVALTLSVSAASASLLGSTSGPDSSYSIAMFFENTRAANLTSLTIDGSTASAGSILWDSIGTTAGSAGAASTIGEDSTKVTLTYAAGDFASGDTLALFSVDPDFASGPTGVTIGEMAGVSILATFDDASTYSGIFVDDPADGAGLVLKDLSAPSATVPLPAGGALLLSALGTMAAVRRSRRA